MDLEYDCLNLLHNVRNDNMLVSNYLYLSAGTKLGVFDNSGNGYLYIGSMIYKVNNGSTNLESIAFSDGKIYKTNSSYNANYHLTDHLGA